MKNWAEQWGNFLNIYLTFNLIIITWDFHIIKIFFRYYYKSKIFQPVLGKRLVYQFGPNAKGWQTDNPNFRR